MLDANAQLAGTCIPPHLKTKCGNGKRHYAVKIDERSLWARRGREIYESVINDLGGIGRFSTAQEQLVRRLSGLCVVAEAIEVKIAQGEMPGGDTLMEYIATINAMRRIAHSVGLRRVPKETQDLDAYIGGKYGNGPEIDGEAT
jgi:hypothetical protein